MESAPAPTPDPSFARALSRLTEIGLGVAEAVAEVAQAERRAVAAACRWLPTDDTEPTSLAEATRIGQGIDAAREAIGQATPRLATITQCFERISRAVRRTVALARRLEQGWPPPRAITDDRQAMLLRQAIRGTRETIRTHTTSDSEAAERLFADLDAHLDDPAFEHDLLERPVKEMVEMLCRAIGLPLPEPRQAEPALFRHDPGRLGDEPSNRRSVKT